MMRDERRSPRTDIYDVHWRGRGAKFLVANARDLIQSCFVRGYFFSVEELEDLLSYLEPNSVILDVGANVGSHTVFLAKFARAMTVVPFEVDPTAAELLRLNVELNELANVDLSHVGVGVGSRRGDLYLRRSIVDNSGATSFSTSASSNSGAPVFKADALDSMLSSTAQVDFIKIDVEGMEFDVLDGAKKLIQRCRPMVFLECWGWVAGLRLVSWLVGSNYRIEKKYGPSYLVVPLAPTELYPLDFTGELAWSAVGSIAESEESLAREAIARLQDRFRTNPHVSYAFAEILAKLNHMDSAQKAMQAIEESADYGVVAWYQALAELSERRGDDIGQLNALRKAAELCPNDAGIAERLANVYKTLGEEGLASSWITSFLDRNPESAKAHHVQSMLAERRGERAEALEHAAYAAELDSPDKPSFLVRFADLTRVLGESPVAALGIVNEAIRLGQTSDWAFRVKAAILETLGDEQTS